MNDVQMTPDQILEQDVQMAKDDLIIANEELANAIGEGAVRYAREEQQQKAQTYHQRWLQLASRRVEPQKLDDRFRVVAVSDDGMNIWAAWFTQEAYHRFNFPSHEFLSPTPLHQMGDEGTYQRKADGSWRWVMKKALF